MKKTAAPKQSRPDKTVTDAGLKIQGMGLLWDAGFVVRPEVLLSEPVKSSGRTRNQYLDVTDVDVLGYQFDSLLSLRTVCVDCGAGTSRSPMDRAFWLRGLREAMGMDQVMCVVGRPIEEEHRFAAHRFGIQLIHSEEFPDLISKLTDQRRLVDFSRYYQANLDWSTYTGNIPGTLHDFLTKDNWQRDWSRIPVTVPGQLRRWTANLDFRSDVQEHGAIELGLLLSIGIVKLAYQVTRTKPSDFKNAVRTSVLGGDRQTKVIDLVLKALEDLEPGTSGEQSLFQSTKFEVPFLPELLDLVSRFNARPAKASRIPRYIQSFQLARLAGDIRQYPQYLGTESDAISLKLALDVFRYMEKAGELRGDLKKLLGEL
ncbi:MAG: hypothetical protein CBB60_001600 [Armatimonadetes bacterium Cent15-Ar3]|nr:MAG: hypothetical protein CBB60_001600 [Armatimonadetes bacterium Cent15-Ar3]